jgi:chromosome segregation ATPase
MSLFANRASRTLALLATTAVLIGTTARADEDPRVAREREMLHRTQEALRQSQADNSEVSKAKLEAEAKLKVATDQIEATRRAAIKAQSSLQVQQQAVATSQTQLAELAHKLDDATQQLAILKTKQHDTSAQLVERETELKQVQLDLQHTKTAQTSCEAKNLKLYEYSQALLDRYHKKGVWDALTQKEPVFGFKEVGIENTMQEYRQKLDAEKLPQESAN